MNKRIFKVVGILAIFMLFTGCFASLDTFRYWEGAGPGEIVQTYPCDIVVVKINEAVMFDYDSNVITKDGNTILDKVASVLKDNPEMKVYLTGYASIEGSDQYNQGLSQRRVDAVKVSLMDRGISADRMTTEAKGETSLWGELLENNRRVMVLSLD
jgi:outer membrane protein OmpA-like peptidoglycan-associated protein